MNPLTLKHNKTTVLIMPMAFYGIEHGKGDSIISTEEFINAYIGDIDEPEHDDKILISYTDTINDELTYEVYEVPEEFKDDYWKIVSSQYSKISDKYRDYLLDFWEQDATSNLYQILRANLTVEPEVEMKKGVMRDRVTEVLDDFDIFEEVYNMGVL